MLREKKNKYFDWFFRIIKGVFIGFGFILPGVSGGAMAAVFGIYERLISFIAHIRKNFVENVLFFLPVGIGAVLGILLTSVFLSPLLENYAAEMCWFFIGCIIGTLPTLWKQGGKKGRKPFHIGVLIISSIAGTVFLLMLEPLMQGRGMPLSFGTWVVAGVLIALGVLVPGLSPSNFLLYLGLYEPMLKGFKSLDVSVALPILIGMALTLLLFSKLMDYVFNKAYAGMYHFIIGIVIASTIMIIPFDYNYFSWGTAICAILCVLGIMLASWMSKLEEKYVPEK